MTFSQSDSLNDKSFMQRALSLAERARFSTDPNPAVGCVIVKGDQIVTEGWTQPAGELHAEAYAIANSTESLVFPFRFTPSRHSVISTGSPKVTSTAIPVIVPSRSEYPE